MKKLVIFIAVVILFTGCSMENTSSNISSEDIASIVSEPISSTPVSSVPISSIPVSSEPISSEQDVKKDYISLLKEKTFPEIEMRKERGMFLDDCYCFFYDVDNDNVPELFFGIDQYPIYEYRVYDFQNDKIIEYDGFIKDNGHGKFERSEFGGLEIYYSNDKTLIKSLRFNGKHKLDTHEVLTRYYNVSDNTITEVAGLSYTWTGAEEKPDHWFMGSPAISLKSSEEITKKEYDDYCKKLTEGMEYEFVPFVKIESVLEADNLENGLKKAYQEYQERVTK